MTNYNPYAQRKLLRTLEKLWTKFEGFINRFTKSDFNPFYHLGTLTIFMFHRGSWAPPFARSIASLFNCGQTIGLRNSPHPYNAVNDSRLFYC